MWGSAVESETSGGTSAAAAWGAPVAGTTCGDPTAAWMAGAGGGQTGWGGGGPTSSKGWDAQQQQSNLVASAGANNQTSGNSWQTAPNGVAPVGGWTGSGGGGQTNWNTGPGQQWAAGTSPGGGSTWAGVAGRHASATSATTPQTPIQQGAVSNTGPVVTTPTAAAVRPKGAPGGFDGSAVGWGKPIDQGTPWEVRQGGGESNTNAFVGATASGAPSGQWSNSGGGANWNAGGTQHSNSGGNISRENSWQSPTSDGRDGRGSYGGGYGGGKPVRGSTDGHQWGESSGGWDGIPAQQRHSSSGNMWNNQGGMDVSQQREQPANVWTGPPAPADMADSHMIWTNPYPKKTAQPDKGTTAWGDPTIQGEIKRWKTNNEGDLLPALTALPAPASSNAQQAQSGAGAGNGNSGIQQAQQPPAWKDSSTPTPQQSKVPSWGTGENAGQTSSSSIPSPTSVAGGWGDQTTATQGQATTGASTSGTSSKTPTAYDRDGIATAGWGASGAKPAPPVQLLTKSCSWTGVPPGFQQQSGFGLQHQHAQGDASRNSVESDGGNVSDDVFSSNPTTPLSAGGGPPGQPGSTMILSKKQQQQQMPNGFGPHSGSASNQNLNQLVSKLGVQNAQLQNLAYGANAGSMAGGAGGRVPQQILTQQIADQLKGAVRAGLIDVGILHQPLPQETLLRLNQLLQCVPKLDQAQKEMLQLQTQSANQPQGLNAAQTAEYQRVSNEVNQLRQTMASLKQAISNQTQNANAGGGQQQQGQRNGAAVPNASAEAAGDSGQSKLEQWKRGSTNGVINGTDGSGSGSGGAVFGVGLAANANDPWSNTPAKRNSGADWPQSPATTPGDTPKSPDKQSEGKGENQQQQIGETGNRMPTPVSTGNSGNETPGNPGAGSLTTPTLLDDVPEFKPGQPWNWRDPKELAEDPDATPGSVKRPALLNSDFFGGGASPGGHLGGNAASELMGTAALVAGIGAMNFGNNPAMMGGGGYPNFGGSGMLPSSFYGQKGGMSGPGGFGGQQGGLGDSWPTGSGGMPRASRPPSQMSQPIGGRAPFKHSMPTPNTSAAAGFMPPYNMGASAPAQWVVLTNLNMIDEPSLQLMMSRIAPVNCCMVPHHGAGFAVVKFKDVSLDKVLPRLQQECSAVGVTIQLAKDDEVSRLIQAVTGQRGGGPPGGGGHLFGAPPPPPHHLPSAMGPAIWDAPPPQAAGPWGAPPPQATGLHHQGAGGPFAPHPAALTDPTVAGATAMSMPMPPGMHDGGLFAPVGHDRHAPF